MSESISKINLLLGEYLPGAKLNIDGAIGIQRPDLPLINIEVTKNSDVCHLYANVMTLQDEEDESILFVILEMNRFGRPLHNCWLALNSENRTINLCHNLYIPVTDSAMFNQALDNFMIALKEVKIKLNEQAEIAI